MLKYCGHEFNNPLNVIHHLVMYTADSLRKCPTETHISTAVSDLDIASSQCQHLEHIVADIMVIQKLEEGRIRLHPELCYIKTIVSELQSSLQTEQIKPAVQLLFEYEEHLTLLADAARLRQILLNYLTNAAKFTVSGHIVLRVRQEQECTLFEVEDTGCGIADARKAKIFAPVGSAYRHRGSGLGLYLVSMLSRAMGGTVGFISAAAQGSTFWLRLPNDAVCR
jgi:signal transduction histidine kinase